MNTVKHLKGLNSQLLRKRRFSYGIKRYIPAMLLSSLIGTYLDLYFTGKELYFFPVRPFSGVFSIHIIFTLVVLPIIMAVLLKIMSKWSLWKRSFLIVFISLGMTVFEKLAEKWGLFAHSNQWNHLYTLIGYSLFLLVISIFHEWFHKKVSK